MFHNKVFFVDDVSLHNESKALKTSDDKVVVPLKNKPSIIQVYHDESHNPGTSRTCFAILSNFWWPSLREDVDHHASHCDVCARLKKRTGQ